MKSRFWNRYHWTKNVCIFHFKITLESKVYLISSNLYFLISIYRKRKLFKKWCYFLKKYSASKPVTSYSKSSIVHSKINILTKLKNYFHSKSGKKFNGHSKSENFFASFKKWEKLNTKRKNNLIWPWIQKNWEKILVA